MEIRVYNWFLRNFIYRYWYIDLIFREFEDRYCYEYWLRENIPNRWKFLSIGYDFISFGYITIYCFCFKTKEDLMAFKLKWCNNGL